MGKNLTMESIKKTKETRKDKTKMEWDGDVFLVEKSEVRGETEINNRHKDLGYRLMKGFLIVLDLIAMEILLCFSVFRISFLEKRKFSWRKKIVTETARNEGVVF